MLTQREMAENYYSNSYSVQPKAARGTVLTRLEKLVAKAQKSAEKCDELPTDPLFTLNLVVSPVEVSVDCQFPGGRIAGSGNYQTVLPLLKSVIARPEVQKLFGEGK